MIRPMIAYLAGAASTAAAVYLAGGTARAGVLIGATVVMLAVLTFARTAARLLLAAADAADQFRASYTQPKSSRLDTAPAAGDSLNETQRDVIAALKNQGMSLKQARARVIAAGEATDFETLFRKVVSA